MNRKGKINPAFVFDFDLHFRDDTVKILGHKDYVTILNPDSASREAYL